MSKIENIYDHPNYYSLADFEGEVWKQIPDVNPQYFVSNLGRVKRNAYERPVCKNKCGVPEQILKNNTIRYQRVSIEGRAYFIHKAVALAFLGPKPSAKHQVNHKNGVKKDNRPENLEWVTGKENIQHAWETGLCKVVSGIDRWLSFQVAQYLSGKLIAVHASLREAEKATNVSRTSMIRSIKMECASCGFTWKRITKEEYFILKDKM